MKRESGVRIVLTLFCGIAAATLPPGAAAQQTAEAPRVERRIMTVPAGQDPSAPAGEPRIVRRGAPPPARTGERAEVAIELVEGMPTVTAMVNGRGPYRFGVDTGAAGYLIVTPALAQTLGLRQIGEAMQADPSGANPTRIPLYSADTFTLGGLTFSGVMTTPLTLPNPRLQSLDGIIGIRFFQDLLLTIDYAALRLTAAPGSLPAADGKRIVDITLDRGVLITLPLRVGDAVYPVHLDTGNVRYPYFMPSAAIASMPTKGVPRDIGVARTVSQEIELKAIDLAAPVSVGTTRLPVSGVAYPSIAEVGNIGSKALPGMVVTIDVANKRLRIVPAGG